MARDTGIAQRLRSAGLNVVEVAGWQTRGSAAFRPRGVVLHHTAGARRGNAPSLRICIHGRSDLAGPLCNVLIGRDGTCYVIAAGRANHAGPGSWKGLIGNSSVYGIEVENTGYNIGPNAEPWSDTILDTVVQASEALAGPNIHVEMICQHKEWAPRRKIDMHTISGGWMRLKIAVLRNQPLPPTPPAEAEEDDEMKSIIIRHHDGTTWLHRGPWRQRIGEAEIPKLRFLGATELDMRNDPANSQWWFDTNTDIDIMNRAGLVLLWMQNIIGKLADRFGIQK